MNKQKNNVKVNKTNKHANRPRQIEKIRRDI